MPFGLDKLLKTVQADLGDLRPKKKKTKHAQTEQVIKTRPPPQSLIPNFDDFDKPGNFKSDNDSCSEKSHCSSADSGQDVVVQKTASPKQARKRKLPNKDKKALATQTQEVTRSASVTASGHARFTTYSKPYRNLVKHFLKSLLPHSRVCARVCKFVSLRPKT